MQDHHHIHHGHNHGADTDFRAPRRVRTALGIAVILIGLATVVGIWRLWPSAGEIPPTTPFVAEGATYTTGEVVGTDFDAQYGDAGALIVRLKGSDEQVIVLANPEVPASEVSLGDQIRVIEIPSSITGSAPVYAFVDYERAWPMIILLLGFVAVVIAVARWKGLAALAGLAGGLAMICVFTIPALIAGKPPVVVALFTASAVMFIVIYLAHGISLKSTTALLSTLVSIGIVTLIGWLAIPGARLTPRTVDEMGHLSYLLPGLDVKGILLCAMVLAGVGVLNDVTITQASVVWELRAAAPSMTRRSIIGAAMRIGRDHIASTVYTIAFAYVGTALALLLVASMVDHTFLDLITLNDVAQEIVATLVTSIGLVMAIPLSTVVGAGLIGRAVGSEQSVSVSPSTLDHDAAAWDKEVTLS